MKTSFKDSRLIARIWLLWHALFNLYFAKSKPVAPQKILIATQLLLGDCVLIVSLVEKVRAVYPNSQVVVALPAYAYDIYQALNLGVTLLVWREKDLQSLKRIKAHGRYDVAFVPYEKWGAIWARAFGALEVIGFSFPNVRWHDRFLTRALPVSDTSVPVSDWVTQLVPGELEISYKPHANFPHHHPSKPVRRVMLHIGARNPNRRWLAIHWESLAEMIRKQGWQVVWSYAPDELAWASQINKAPQDEDIGGKLSFDGLLKQIASVDAVICPDTGIVHLCKLTATPNVVIYGQGNPAIHGNGVYWQHSQVRNVFIEDIACRDMHTIFGREIKTLNRCDRGLRQCSNPYCQNDIHAEMVMKQLQTLLAASAAESR